MWRLLHPDERLSMGREVNSSPGRRFGPDVMVDTGIDIRYGSALSVVSGIHRRRIRGTAKSSYN